MLETEVDAGIGRLTLDRPERRNALSNELMQGLSEALANFAADPEVRAVVITGRGAAFCAGADLNSMKGEGGGSSQSNSTSAQSLGALFHQVADFPKPTVALVNGPAIGGGVGLLAACDIVMAVASAKFQFSEVRLGLVPAVISPFCIERLGVVRARRLFLTGERFDAETALSYGLVDRVCSEGSLHASCEAVLRDLRAAGPQALVAAKELVKKVATMPREQVLEYTSKLIADLRAGEEAQAGMQAFLNKVAPPWVADEGEGSGS